MKQREEILAFIASKSLMTISSLGSDGKPQAAVVGFGQTEEFQLVFGTSNLSRKYANIKNSPNVAVVIGWDGPQTVQYEGVAREITGPEAEKYSERYFAKNPHARKNKELPDQCYILVDPAWLKLTDLSVTPWDVVELRF
jgi:pyridoxine/pyridoxamine 5'-phosphate oxidase